MSDGTTPIIIFLDGSETGSEIVWAPSSNYTSPDVAYDFTPTSGDTLASHYTNTGSTYSYTPPVPPTPTPLPNPTAFLAACVADASIKPLYYLLAPYYAAIENYSVSPTAVQLLWSQLCTQYSSLLTSDIQILIEGYATTNNMPLV